MPEVPAVSCRRVGVSFGEVNALAEVSIDIPNGGIHAVVGQNGAGKTTFARVVAGIVKPDSGELEVNGRSLSFGSVASSRSAGIELVHQNFALPPSFTVAEAIEFGTGGGFGLFSRSVLIERCRKHLNALGLQIDPRQRVRNLPIEQQQAVEIARALTSNARILILDEPTAVLPPPGIESLFERIRRLKENGVTIILILHKTREVWAIADTISVLRNGRLIAGPVPRNETDPGRIASMIMGSSTDRPADQSTAPVAAAALDKSADVGCTGPAALELDGISTGVATGESRLDQVSLTVRPGEIVGLAGVEGNGQATLVNVLAGLTPTSEGEIFIGNRPVRGLGLADRRSLGLRVIPFDRNSEGLSLTSELWENWAAGELAAGRLLAPINPAKIRERCGSSMSDWGVRFNSPTQPAASLSGGNAQKLILSRELDESARIVIAAQPTRGLDIGATAFVWSTLRQAVAGGCGALIISSDLDELFETCNRILVILSGRIEAELKPPFDLTAAGRAMMGAAR